LKYIQHLHTIEVGGRGVWLSKLFHSFTVVLHICAHLLQTLIQRDEGRAVLGILYHRGGGETNKQKNKTRMNKNKIKLPYYDNTTRWNN